MPFRVSSVRCLVQACSDDSFATRQLLGLEVLAVGRQGELCFRLGGRGAVFGAVSVFVTWPLPHVTI
jgi:hypothetical protein